ncbi:Spermatogenesis-defective protein 39 [Aphelenchoides fujianensis]|nr:Spermatogenesis-defective protein 39 [Aphelenchoides fujianensis]KAI6224253.1 Spermatogenesis-defective protein 39 [Aphelenchoides fujianensis]
MEFNRQFTFDDPEDAYWNDESGSAFFDDGNPTAVEARQALDTLFEQHLELPDAKSTGDSESFESATNRPLSTAGRPSTSKQAADFSAPTEQKRQANLEAVGEKPRRLGSVSVISDCSVGSFNSESTVHFDYARLKAEHHKLQRYLEHVRHERFQPLPVAEAIKRLRACRNVSLDFYRSKQQKVELLDAAVASLSDDIVIVVLMFLKRTMSGPIFREVLVCKPGAAQIFVNFLREGEEHQELTDTLFALGRSDEAAMVELSLALRTKGADAKLAALKRCLVGGLSSPTLQQEADGIREFVDLVERQIPIDCADEETARAGNDELFRAFPKKATLVGQPLLTTLYYCCLYHYALPANTYASPLAFKHAFPVSEREFAWTALSALCRRRAWADVERLLAPQRKLLPMPTRLQCPLSWTAFFGLVAKYGPPPSDVLNRWLRAVPEADERFRMADQFGDAARDVQLDALTALKDKKKLVALMSKLAPNSANFLKAQSLLSNLALKWN